MRRFITALHGSVLLELWPNLHEVTWNGTEAPSVSPRGQIFNSILALKKSSERYGALDPESHEAFELLSVIQTTRDRLRRELDES